MSLLRTNPNPRERIRAGRIEAVLFDMDGLLIDSEPFWREAEIIAFGSVGLELTDEMCRQTLGLRVDDVVEHWYRLRPWPDVPKHEVERRIIDEGIHLIQLRGEPMAGVADATRLVASLGMRTALVSSSPRRLIRAVIARLGLEDAFELVHSAEDEEYGKPHPAVYLAAAAKLGVAPTSCVAIEDSLPGVLSAKAARMRCVAVPESSARHDPRFSLADVTLGSLAELTGDLLARLEG